jgi:dTMP kinase
MLISIEGLDGSGKTVFTESLCAAFNNALVGNTDGGEGEGAVNDIFPNLNFTGTQTISFPQYDDSFYGSLLKKTLHSKEITALNPYTLTFLFAGDRYESKEQIMKWLEAGSIVVANRYVTSNMAYGMAKAEDPQNFLQFNQKLEYEACGLPQPDFVIYLDTPMEVIQERLNKKDMDEYEKDSQYLLKVKESYDTLHDKHNNWVKIKTCTDNNEPKSPANLASEAIQRIVNHQVIYSSH